MKLKNPKDFWSGVMFMAIGLAFAIVVKVFEYPMGTSSRMGPGYFPFVLGIVMTLLGVAIIIESMATQGEPVSKFAWRPLAFILGAVVIFGLIVKVAGMAASIIVLVLVSAFGGHEFKLKEVLIAGVILAVFSVLVFVYGLKLPFPIWPSFISG
ncbi:MAG: tripartite tricarboxylate transporter TctB family protein [Betaproteobacteria bacterium]|nr:tripartite tricarboxylate transporter TctB family protein [Betaproteobacteria bacterium]